MGFVITKEEIESKSSEQIKYLTADLVRTLGTEAREIYDRRIYLQSITTDQMRSLGTIHPSIFKEQFLRDLKPEVREIYNSRMLTRRITVKEMMDYSEETVQNFAQRDLEDL